MLVLIAACHKPEAELKKEKTEPALAAPLPPYVLTGDLKDIQKKGAIRFLVAGADDYMPRDGDPAAAEHALAEAFAKKLGLSAEFIHADRSALIEDLNDGHGDVIAASLAVTPERATKIAFSRPLRFVKELVVQKADAPELKTVADLKGKEVTVRASSSYAVALAKVPGVVVKPADEKKDTFSLIEEVSRGEIAMTVADSDIVEAAQTFMNGFKATLAVSDKDPIAWGVRKSAGDLKSALDGFVLENALTLKKVSYKADLEDIKKRQVLRVLTRNNSTCFFIYRGEQLGFEYELARAFAKELGVRLEVIVPPSREALEEYLRDGKGDIVAAGLVATSEREKEFAFTRGYSEVSEIVVAKQGGAIKSLDDLKGHKVTVRKSSSYYATLQGIKDKYGFSIDVAPEEKETEELLDELGAGKIEATVADSNIVEIEMQQNDKLNALGPIAKPQQQAWMVRKDQPQLQAAADEFLKKTYKSVFYNMTVTKYFKNTKQIKAATGDERADAGGHLSSYDDLVKKYAKQYEFDWRLVTSQMYQESHFDPAAKSWVGALGLLQVMPKTAQELRIDNIVEPDNGIHAGVKLMAKYSGMFSSDLVKEKDRIRFALAAYNCGPGHVIDARRIAKDQGLNPDKWFGNVEKAMLFLAQPKYAKAARFGYCRCGEPVKYVSEIQTRYDAYAKLVGLE